ncbi:hypothetical protein ACP4OV_000997 [Aristida adscensionis]
MVIPHSRALATSPRRRRGGAAASDPRLLFLILSWLILMSDNEVYPDTDNEPENIENDDDISMSDLKSLHYCDLDSVSKLQKTQRYNDIMQVEYAFHAVNSSSSNIDMQAFIIRVLSTSFTFFGSHKVENALERGTDISNQMTILEDSECQLVVDCNALSVDIDNEITMIHDFILDKYKLKHPLPESRVHHPIDYAHIMWITLTDPTISGEPRSEDNLVKTIEACDKALNLHAAKKKILEFLESRMAYIAPNLAAIVGNL